MLEERYEKSEAGRAEIKTRALVQGRIARNLLLVIDPTKTGGQWLGMVQGATQADLELLLQHGLVAPAAGAGRAAAAAAAAAASGASAVAPAGSPPSRSAGSLSVHAQAPTSTVAPGSVPAASRPAVVSGTRPMGAPVSSLDFQQLYTALTVFAKQQGLLKGYRLALEVEQCADFEQLQTLALDVVDRIRATKGDAAAHELRETLGFN
ncbi:hypothetical protein [Roseateles depolymerans]|uniref:Putative proline-rich protein n=1 Tax=Roseateles depolymerans TaxID=76731 RepID=A0A0U2UB40_9BURK|nr:hypothetical protein [Roseateles depolymerans]ALV09089.1 Putative proline-rich protein [Roseateles depolymerans]REG13844.1 hypothetical protein DES44_3852 [Roseateles depolymerans]